MLHCVVLCWSGACLAGPWGNVTTLPICSTCLIHVYSFIVRVRAYMYMQIYIYYSLHVHLHSIMCNDVYEHVVHVGVSFIYLHTYMYTYMYMYIDLPLLCDVNTYKI